MNGAENFENRQPTGGPGSNLTNIPEMIDPGVTIPIYEEELSLNNNIESISIQQPQKLGSYRARAGKFSNTLSNLLPSISAKLHHGKKGSKGSNLASEVGAVGELNSGDEATSNTGSRSNSTSIGQGQFTSVTGNITPPMEVDYNEAIRLPDSSTFMVNNSRSQPRLSGDSFTFGNVNMSLQPTSSNTMSRTRNDTVSSQITNVSNVNGLHSNPATMWLANDMGNMNNLGGYEGNAPVSNYFDMNTNNNGHNLAVPGAKTGNIPPTHVWSSRPRSHSNASSIYTDAPLYDQLDTRSRASTFIIPPSMEPQTKNATFSTNPVVQDEVDPRSINWVTTDPTVPPINHISNLLPTNTISISNVFSLQQQQPHLSNTINLTSTSLATLCLKFGTVISARTLKGVNMALVEFAAVDSAIKAKEALYGKEVSLVGAPSVVSFAKVLPMHQPQPQQIHVGSGPTINAQSLLQEQLYSGAIQLQQQGNVSISAFPASQSHGLSQNLSTATTNMNSSNNAEKEHCPFALPPPSFKDNITQLTEIIERFGVQHDSAQYQHIVYNAAIYSGTNDTTDFGPLPEPLGAREFDAPKLRELRKSIDSGHISQLEIEQLVLAMLDELPELSSDYLGNTIVQKLFEHSSVVIKDIMLRKTSKYLTSMGVHKNGTWACQKMITNADTPRQKYYVAKGVYEYCTPLFNDQFGNYVIQCVLKFGFPWNNFIFESIVSNFWIIVQNRYGARAVRACLEAHDIITQEQVLVLSAMIVLFGKYLAISGNGALLVTWFLDTCTLPKRHTILAESLLPNILELGCHKLASLTILKILNYRGDEVAKRMILDAIFGPMHTDQVSKPPKLLYDLLNDNNYGPSFIYKVLCIPMLEGDVRYHVIEQVRFILTSEPNITQHRRLLEEVGLSSITAQQSQQQNSTTKPRLSISHVFGNDHNNSSQHLRTVSVNSVRSSSSRPRASSNSQAQQHQPQQHQHQQQQQQPTQNSQSQMSLPPAYYNYPGMFPGSQANQFSASSSGLNDDLMNNFDMLTLNNGTHISLPQLSMNGHHLTQAQSNPAAQGPQYSNGVYGSELF